MSWVIQGQRETIPVRQAHLLQKVDDKPGEGEGYSGESLEAML